MTIDQLNRLSENDALTAFEQCCGAYQWMERMVYSRPFEDLAEVLETSDNVWDECDVNDYEEAFSFFPRIGHPEDLQPFKHPQEGLNALGAKWAGNELKGFEVATAEEMDKLKDLGTAYEKKFGYLFVINAPGKSIAEVLEAMATRLGNDPKQEIEIAAAEQHKITQLRLKKLLA